MTITKYIVDAMGGTITVESEQGKGSLFHITLDMKKNAEQEKTLHLPNQNVLVIDDDKTASVLAVSALESIGLKAESAADLEEALPMIEIHSSRLDPYHMILLDWEMMGCSFTDDAHTVYTVDSPQNRKALQLLNDLDGITIDLFCKKETAMCFCWNVSMEVQQTINHPDLDFDVFPMAFPTNADTPKLEGGIWGLGIFDNGNEERIEAAKTFIRYITENDAPYIRAVQATTYWPVRDLNNIYENDALMTEYNVFTPYMGDYYQITPGWTDARTAWWQMLTKIESGTNIAEAVKDFPSPD